MPVQVLNEFNGGRFLLWPFRAEDAAALFEAVQISRAELQRWIPWVVCDSVERAGELCERYAREFWDHKEFRFAIWADGELVGTTCYLLRGSSIDAGVGEVGMWIRSDWAGKGMATSVLQAMVDWGFRDWGWHRLTWKCDTENLGSVRVAEKCGFRLEGTLRQDMVDDAGNRSDTHFFAMLRTEWLGPV